MSYLFLSCTEDFDNEISSNTIEVYVHHIRSKLGKDIIRTIRGLGYRLGQARNII